MGIAHAYCRLELIGDLPVGVGKKGVAGGIESIVTRAGDNATRFTTEEASIDSAIRIKAGYAETIRPNKVPRKAIWIVSTT